MLFTATDLHAQATGRISRSSPPGYYQITQVWSASGINGTQQCWYMLCPSHLCLYQINFPWVIFPMEKCQQVNSMTMELSTDQVFFSRNLYPSFLFWTSLHTLKSITEFSIRDLQFSVHRSPLRLISEHHKLSSSKLVTCHHVSQNLEFCIYTEPSLPVTYTHTHTPIYFHCFSFLFQKAIWHMLQGCWNWNGKCKERINERILKAIQRERRQLSAFLLCSMRQMKSYLGQTKRVYWRPNTESEEHEQ